MTNLYLPVKIAPITPELLERLRCEWTTYRVFDNEIVKLIFNAETKFWMMEDGTRTPYKDEHLTHYLPDGLPSPDDAVEIEGEKTLELMRYWQEKERSELREENEYLKEENTALQAKIEKMDQEIEEMSRVF
jgi:hypothetical protein